MGNEKLAAIDQEAHPTQPTTLHLFRYKNPEMEILRGKAAGALQLEQNITNINNSLQTLNVQKNARLIRLSQTAK
jgi:hypothetical protein